MKTHKGILPHLVILILLIGSCSDIEKSRSILDFNADWYFQAGDLESAHSSEFDHSMWRMLDLPHDWSIEGVFSPDHPATVGGGALPGGIGWYRKTFTLDNVPKDRKVFVQFDGIYMNSDVWINGNYLGNRPFGYSSFEYDLTPFIDLDGENVIAVRVDNSKQPNSRWYSGSGIYRNTRLIITSPIYVPQWGTYVTTSKSADQTFLVSIATQVVNEFAEEKSIALKTELKDGIGNTLAESIIEKKLTEKENTFQQSLAIDNPELWDVEDPSLYTVVSSIYQNGGLIDQYSTRFGFREFGFDVNKGFILNGRQLKIKGVCQHHDLGCLGAAVNRRAIERQLGILKDMGANAIRTAHNPPAPELLDLCDEMGILVMNETFDIWSKGKSTFDYSLHWDDWYDKDLKDHVKRDRNHPSVIAWSIGNEILNQWDTSGSRIANELAQIVRDLDPTRPVTSGMNPPASWNSIASSGALDLIGYNYHHAMFEEHLKAFPTKPFIGTETNSALATRGYYDPRSDTIMRWPIRWDLKFTEGNEDFTVSAYDQVSAPWGSTHEETWKIVKKHEFLSGMFIWTGFDYLGEPTPYEWPARSSYFGVIDLAGFPKDSYYMYQSEWTNKDVLHVFPHWNWSDRDSVDVWVYSSTADVELFLNGKSQGKKQKENGTFHLMWRVAYEPGAIKAVGYQGREIVNERLVQTTGEPSKIKLRADWSTIKADGYDLSFVTVTAEDGNGLEVPTATNLVEFELSGEGKIVGVDNGDPTSHLSLKGSKMKLMAGKCLVVLQSAKQAGTILLKAKSDGLEEADIEIRTNNN